MFAVNSLANPMSLLYLFSLLADKFNSNALYAGLPDPFLRLWLVWPPRLGDSPLPHGIYNSP